MSYLFKSERLGFRNWQTKDLEIMTALNNDAAVMEFFPAMPTKLQTEGFIKRMQAQFEKRNYCYFAVDELSKNELIGFIGICYQDYEADFTPCTDIGWRLKKSAWNKGYATEGAKACLDYAFNHLGLEKIYSIASTINVKSIHVMKKIGMEQVGTFEHPKLLDSPDLKECVLFLKCKI